MKPADRALIFHALMPPDIKPGHPCYRELSEFARGDCDRLEPVIEAMLERRIRELQAGADA